MTGYYAWNSRGFLTILPDPIRSQRFARTACQLFHAEWAAADPVIQLHGGLGSVEVFGAYVGSAVGLYVQNSATPDGFGRIIGAVMEMWGTQPNYSEAELQSVSALFTMVQALHNEAIIDEHAEQMARMLPDAT